MTAKKSAVPQETEPIIAELRHLRTLGRQTAESFILRCEADIEAAVSCLSRMPAGALRRKRAEWGKLLKGLKVKPEKGRLKDLKELHNLVEKLLADVLEESERKPRKKKGVRPAPEVVATASEAVSHAPGLP